MKLLNISKVMRKEALGYKRKKLVALIITLPFPFIISILAYFLGVESTTIIALFSLGLISVILPYLAFNFLEFQEIKKVEDQFPNFLRDLAQSVASGMTFTQAITNISKTKYGELSKYIDKLNIWLSWGIPFPKAWRKFTVLLERSSLIKRVNGIVFEAFHSGGDIKTTLNYIAEDVNLLKQMEAEKESIMRQQVAIMYVVFFIFVGVIVGVYKILAPILFIQQLGTFASISINSGGGQLTISYFKNLFFLMTLIEAVCAGLIAGQISEEKLIAGLKHITIMLAVGIFLFFIFIFPTQLNLEVSLYPPVSPPGGQITIVGRVFYESSPASGAAVDIIKPNKEVTTIYVDNVGDFRANIDAPVQPGQYTLVVVTRYEGESATTSRPIRVE